MNVIIPTENFNINNVFFQEPIKNNIFDNSNFIKIIYSNNSLTLNCVIIEFNLFLLNHDIFYNKHKYSYNVNVNFDKLLFLYAIEKNILNKLLHLNKKPVYRLYDSLILGHIKVFHEKNDCINNNANNNNANNNNANNNNANNNNAKNNLININLNLLHSFGLKISGVWENNIEYGLTYKFIKL